MSESHYVYWWVDGIHTGLRTENSDGQCVLAIIGVKPDGSNERVAVGDVYRETKASDRFVPIYTTDKAGGI